MRTNSAAKKWNERVIQVLGTHHAFFKQNKNLSSSAYEVAQQQVNSENDHFVLFGGMRKPASFSFRGADENGFRWKSHLDRGGKYFSGGSEAKLAPLPLRKLQI